MSPTAGAKAGLLDLTIDTSFFQRDAGNLLYCWPEAEGRASVHQIFGIQEDHSQQLDVSNYTLDLGSGLYYMQPYSRES